jgi:hypothetical protein
MCIEISFITIQSVNQYQAVKEHWLRFNIIKIQYIAIITNIYTPINQFKFEIERRKVEELL